MVDVQVTAPNGEVGTIPEENLPQALQAGFTQATTPTAISLPGIQNQIKPEDIASGGQYNVVAPDGTHGTVPVDKLPSALQNGFMLRSQHTQQSDFKGRVEYWKKQLTTGATGGEISTGLRGYADEFLAGGAEKAEQWLGQNKEERNNPETQLENKAYAQAVQEVNDEQSTSHAAGAVGGFLGQTYLGGKLAGGAAPTVEAGLTGLGVTNPLLMAAAKEAVAGGITVSPQAMAQAIIDQDPTAAAESLLVGIGTGALIGTGLKAASGYFGRIEKANTEVAKAAQREEAITSHPVSLNVPSEDLTAPETEQAIYAGKNPAVQTEEGLGHMPEEGRPFEVTNQARGVGGRFVAGRQVGLGDLGVNIEGGEVPEAIPESPINLANGPVAIHPNAELINDILPAHQPIFNIGDITAPKLVHTELNRTEKLLLDHLGLTRGMRRNIGEVEDQRRILRILAKELGNDNVEAGTKVMASTTREELARKVKDLVDENGPRIGKIRKELDAMVEKNPDLKPPILAMADEINKLKEGLVSPEEENVVKHAVKLLQEKGDGALFNSFTEADKVKNYFQDQVDWSARGAEKAPNRVAANVARIVRLHVEEAAKNIAKATQSSKIIEDWSHFKTLYGVGKTLDLAADQVLNAPITHEFIPGGHGALGAGYLGHVVGGALGVPIVGPVVGVVGAKLLKNYLREGGIAKIAHFLGGRIQDPAISSYVAMDAVKAISSRLEEVPRMVKSFAEAGIARAISKTPVDNSIKVVLGDEANGLSKEQQFAKLADRVNFAHANQEHQQQQVEQMVEGVAQHHPQLATELSMAMQKKLEYLYTILPKNPNAPMPFKHETNWKPSPAQLHDFMKQLAVANDPFHALEELKAGTLTASQVATLAVINPDLLMKMRGELIKVSMDKKVNLNYQQRLTMGIMLGQQIDQQLFAIPSITPPLGAGAAAPAGKAKGAGKKPSLKANALPNYRTSFQKIADKSD